MDDTAKIEDRRELVTFRLDKQEFCIDILSVREIRGRTEITTLPHAPHYVRGMINLRGTVLPIVDVGARLGIPVDDSAPRRVIIVVWIGTKLVGLLVDAVCDIITVPVSSIQLAPKLGGEEIEEFVSSVLTVEERTVCVIALDHLLPELNAVAA